MKKKMFKLYSGDGGGCFGASPAYLNMAADRIQEFDGYIGTSIHAAICAAYAIGIDAGQVNTFMADDMKEVFKRPWYRCLCPVGPKWPDASLNDAIQRLVGKDTKMGDVPKPLFITAMNFKHDIPKVFDNLNEDDKRLNLWEVIRCSVAANTYFPTWCPYHDGNSNFFTDGGTWANTPSLAGAIAVFDKIREKLKYISVFSVGCGVSADPNRKQKDVDGWGAVRMGLSTLESMFDGGNERAMTHMLYKLIDGRLTRFNEVELDKKWKMDDPSIIPELRKRSAAVFDDFKDKLDTFLDGNI